MIKNTDIPYEEFEEIERFLLKQLSEEENNRFLERLTSESDLRQKVYSIKLLMTGISEASIIDKINTYHTDITTLRNQKSAKAKIISIKRWMIAASVILVGSFIVFLIANPANTKEKLFAKYYSPDPGLITAMSETDNYGFDRAMIDYKTKDYGSALESWRRLLSSNSTNDTLNYFIASALLAQNKFDEAIDFFKKVTADKSSYFYKDACWYTGLALLRINKRREAVSFIEKSAHRDKDAILKELEK